MPYPEDNAMKSSTILITVLFMLGGFFNSALSAEQEQIVIEDLSMSELRQQIDIVQKEFYRVFNTLNDDDEFDIICHRYTPTGTNISQEACEPQFVITRRALNVREWQSGNDVLLEQDELMAALELEFAELTQKISAVATDNQYFLELNQVLGMLNERMAELTN